MCLRGSAAAFSPLGGMDGAGMALLESAGFAGMAVGWDSARPVAVQSKAATINVLFMTYLLKALGCC